MKEKNQNLCSQSIQKYKHENYRVKPIVMHFEYFRVHPHINDRICDNCVRLLIAHKYEIFLINNERYNHRQRDAKQEEYE